MAKLNPLQQLEVREAMEANKVGFWSPGRVIVIVLFAGVVAYALQKPKSPTEPLAAQAAVAEQKVEKPKAEQKVEKAKNETSALATTAAPKGDAKVVAHRIILENFDRTDCPLIVAATRLGDGSIKAKCDNGQDYRVFSVIKGEKTLRLAMRCSAARSMGVSGC
jgi:hypothetical protein